MGLFDNIKERLNMGGDEEYYDDFEEYYDDSSAYSQQDTTGVLGNTRRPEAESVSVYTRSGRHVENSYDSAPQPGTGYVSPSTFTSVPPVSSTPSVESFATSDYHSSYSEPSLTAQNTGRGALGTAGSTTPADIGLKPMQRGALPPYVLKATSYDDVQMVVRRVRTNQPVILSLAKTPEDIATRILDFSFGFATGIGGAVEQVGSTAFSVCPANVSLSQTEIDKLFADGTIKR